MSWIDTLVRSFLVMFLLVLVHPVYSHQDGLSDAAYRQAILHYVNVYRIKHHLAPLTLKNTISQEAQKHSRDMAVSATPFGHHGFNQRIQRLYQKYPKSRGGAENVAYYKLDAKKLVDAWIASRGHRQNILGNYNLTGIGIAHNKKGWGYYTQIFIRNDNPRLG